MSKGPTIGDWTQYGWIPDDASSFPARIRLRNAAWMVYYEPDAVVQREQAERLELREQNAELRDENAKLRALVESYGMIANEAVCDYYDRDEMLADANATVCELGIEVGA